MSTWTIRAPAHPTEAYDISTDAPRFRDAYASQGPGWKVYTLVDAIKWVSYRMDVGDEIVTVQLPMTCPACGEVCSGVWEDFGIGSYEYWGARGTDVRMVYVSNCCEAQLPEPERRSDDE